MRALLFALATLFALALPGLAVQPGEVLADPALEARAREISRELRCPVCRNESIDDSNADIARDLRLIVRERLVAGDSDADVVAYVVARYGDFVLLRPRFSAFNLVLWGAGPVLLLAGVLILLRWLRRPAAAVAALDAEEEARLAALLKREGGA